MTYEQLQALLRGGQPAMAGVPRTVLGADAILGIDQILAGVAASDLQAAAAARAAGGVAVSQQKRDRVATQIAAFAPVALPAGTAATIPMSTQRLIRIKGLAIPSRLNGLFFITALTAADVNQFISAGSVPCDVFSEVADGLRTGLNLSSMDVGNDASMNVTNRDAVNAQTFEGAFFAVAVFQ